MSQLIVHPTFTFNQAEFPTEDELPIQIIYWSKDIVELIQGNNRISIRLEKIKQLTKLVHKHKNEAFSNLYDHKK